MRKLYIAILNPSIKSVLLFIVVAVLVSLAFYYIIYSIPEALPLLPSGGFLRLSVMGITLSAILTAYITDGSKGIQNIRQRIRPRKKHLYYYFSPVLIFLIAGLSLLLNGHSFLNLLIYTLENGFQFLILFIVSFLIIGMGEEIGWRGFVLPKLMERFSPLLSTLFIIPIWYAFHLPKIIDWSGSVHYFINMLVGIIAFGFLFTLIFIRFKEDVFLIALLHAAYNVIVDWTHSFYSAKGLDKDLYAEFWSTLVGLISFMTLLYFVKNWKSWKKIRYLLP